MKIKQFCVVLVCAMDKNIPFVFKLKIWVNFLEKYFHADKGVLTFLGSILLCMSLKDYALA